MRLRVATSEGAPRLVRTQPEKSPQSVYKLFLHSVRAHAILVRTFRPGPGRLEDMRERTRLIAVMEWKTTSDTYRSP